MCYVMFLCTFADLVNYYHHSGWDLTSDSCCPLCWIFSGESHLFNPCALFSQINLYFKTEANLNFHGKFHVKSTISAFHSRPGQTCILISSDERAALSFLKKTSKSFIFFSSDERASLSFLARNSWSPPSWYSGAKRRGDMMPWWRNL